MSQLFPRSANRIARLTLIGLALAIPLFIGLWALSLQSPNNTGMGTAVEQPIAFSHEIHAGRLDISCIYCHTTAETSPFAGMPSTQQCMTCHSQIVQGLPDVEALAASLQQNIPIEWHRVYNLPDYVYFDHSAHVNGGIACETCHGRVDQMSVVSQAVPLTMDWCLSCHRNPTPNIRPVADVAVMGWQPSANDQAAATPLEQYAINTMHLTDCDICHR